MRLDGPTPAAGAPVLDGELAVGTLGGAAGGEALALLRLDRVEAAERAGRPLLVDGRRVAVLGDKAAYFTRDAEPGRAL